MMYAPCGGSLCKHLCSLHYHHHITITSPDLYLRVPDLDWLFCCETSGLQILAVDMEVPIVFPYAWMSALSGPPKELSWLPLAHAGPSDVEHIRLHNIKDSSALETLFSVGDSKMQALILVNSANSHQLESDILPPLVQAKWSVPVLLMTSSDGESLLRFTERKEGIQVKVAGIDKAGTWTGVYA